MVVIEIKEGIRDVGIGSNNEQNTQHYNVSLMNSIDTYGFKQ